MAETDYSAHIHVLIADDDRDIRRLLEEYFSGHGFTIDLAATGTECLEKVRTNPPHLILLDVIMPELSGIEVCKQLKDSYQTTNIPIIMLSSKDRSTDIVQAFENGADDYVTKPFELDSLLARVRANLRRTSREITANPLTKVPGINFLHQQLMQHTARQNPIAFAICDIDNFKAYNDKYGFDAGDNILRFVADVLRQALINHPSPSNCLGHIGGDDFIFICRIEDIHTICEQIIRDFDSGIGNYYNDTDRKAGFIKGLNRRGIPEYFPIMTLSIGLSTNQNIQYTKLAEFAEAANEMKVFLKMQPESNYMVNRRRK